MSTEATEAAVKLVGILTPLPSEERHRAIAAALMLLGEKPVSASTAMPKERDDNGGSTGDENLSVRARNWMKQNGLTDEALSEVFHFSDGRAEIIASSVPGKSASAKSLNCYVLAGVANLLSTGVPSFTDQFAREICQNMGCYDINNHSKTLKEKGNEFSGTKDKGWELTAPGLKRGAALINEMRTKSS